MLRLLLTTTTITTIYLFAPQPLSNHIAFVLAESLMCLWRTISIRYRNLMQHYWRGYDHKPLEEHELKSLNRSSISNTD